MQSTFFNLSGILPPEDAKEQLEAAIDRMYGSKSPKIVTSNKAALAAAPENLNRVEYPSSWLNAEDTPEWLNRVEYPSSWLNAEDTPESLNRVEYPSSWLNAEDT